MGLDDRDYMRDVPIYKTLIGRGGGAAPKVTSTGAPGGIFPPAPRQQRRGDTPGDISWMWLVLAVLGAAGVFVYIAHRAQMHSSAVAFSPTVLSPIEPAAPSPAPAEPTPPPPRTYSLGGASTAPVGSIMTTTGTLPSGVSGPVVVIGRWGAGPWYRLATSVSQSGGYRVRYLLNQRGLVHIRIELPNGDSVAGTVTVT